MKIGRQHIHHYKPDDAYDPNLYCQGISSLEYPNQTLGKKGAADAMAAEQVQEATK